MNEETLAWVVAAMAGYKDRAERTTSVTWKAYNKGAEDALSMLLAHLRSKE